MPDAADGRALILTQQFAESDWTIGGDPARRIVRFANRDGLWFNIQRRGLRREVAAGQAPGGHAQRGIVFADNQQQLVGWIGGVGDDAQQWLIGFRQRHAAHLLARVANHDTVAFRQAVAQRAEGDAAIVRLDTQPGRDQRRGAEDVGRRLRSIGNGDVRRRHLHAVEEWTREVAQIVADVQLLAFPAEMRRGQHRHPRRIMNVTLALQGIAIVDLHAQVITGNHQRGRDIQLIMGDILAIGAQRQGAERLTVEHQLQGGVAARHFRRYANGKAKLRMDHHLIGRQGKADAPLPLTAAENNAVRHPHLRQIQIASPDRSDRNDLRRGRPAHRRGQVRHIRRRGRRRRIAGGGGGCRGGALLRRGGRGFVAWLAVRRAIELRKAQRRGGAGARFFTVQRRRREHPCQQRQRR